MPYIGRRSAPFQTGSTSNTYLQAQGYLTTEVGDVSNTYVQAQGYGTGDVANNYLQFELGNVGGGLESGTKAIFVQSAAPTGWTKDTTHNDKAMRVVSGSVSSGGSDAFTTTFGSGKTTAAHTLGTSQIPVHSHSMETDFYNGGNITGKVAHGNANDPRENVSTSTVGGGGSHSHNLSGFDLQYVDVIIATKD